MSKTKWITVYKITPQTGSRQNYTLNIIDTPGFGDRDGNQTIIDQIRQLLLSNDDKGVLYIDAVCLVVRAPDARFSASQKLMFNSIMSLFGKDIESNICTFITFADGTNPPVLSPLSEADLLTGSYFQFNNSVLFAENKNLAPTSLSPMFWEMGFKSFQNVFDELDKLTRRSLSQTKDVLKEREKLKKDIADINPQVKAGFLKLSELRKELEILEKLKYEMKNNKDFEYECEEAKIVMVNLMPGQHVTNCIDCNITCHENCSRADDADKHLCSAMSNGYCTVCTGKCKWSVHKNAPYNFKYTVEKNKKTFKEMKQRYEEAKGKKMSHEAFTDILIREIDDVFKSVKLRMVEIKSRKTRLQEIELRPDPLFTVQWLEQIIETEKIENQPGCQRRIQMLNEFKNMANIDEDFEKLGQYLKSSKQEMTSNASDN